ncbi:MAG TPA: GDSL-type esterase/lipase family protein, partial [Prolixibacteraceae bacterium]|nr:GDSL-type esterase/lipase family protein [Prolixibacteraceae bacterium]
LIGSAASVTMQFTGDSCVVYLKNNTPERRQNYFSIEIDGEDLGRTRIEGDSILAIPVTVEPERDIHTLSIFKSTEAANGNIIFCGVSCQLLAEQPALPEKSIEFIGNSITCGMGNDTLDIPCHTDQWYDQHNAYWAYGSIVARALQVNYMLSSVSGIGIYRNWNVEDGPTMPRVYENRYLNTDDSKKWDFSSFTPDVVSICLGTNDLSDGDGIHERHPFDAAVFTSSYIRFIETIYSHYPETQVALLTSPMVTGAKDSLLVHCVADVKHHFDKTSHKPIAVFEFDAITPHGCDYHPTIEDHMEMADQLIPFYQQLLGEED